MKYVTVAEMIAIEKEANASGLTYEIMMENAGRGLAEVIMDKYGYLDEEGALGLIGSGNNGGDTLVALTHMAEDGWKTNAYIVRPRPEDDPLIARLVQAGGGIHWLMEDHDFTNLARLIHEHAILMDGILGTGIQLPVKSELARVLEFVLHFVEGPRLAPIVVAVDCPSGVDCDSGQAASECIPADLTVTMAAMKQGLLKFPAYNLCGEIRLVGIGLPEGGQSMASWRAVKSFVVKEDWARSEIPSRPVDAHKGTFGTSLVVAGSLHYTGAALLAGEAAYRVGSGLVTIAIPEPIHAPLAGHLPEATWLPLAHENGFIAAQASKSVIEYLKRSTALLIGPGFGVMDTTGEFLQRLLESDRLPPVVIDADGLKLLKRLTDWSGKLPSPAVLTPHPGEMSVLTGLPVKEIQADRLGTAKRYSQEWDHVVVLKGAFTVIAAPNGQAAIIPIATAALARAGTGDVLAGLIVGLLSQGKEAFQAATLGAWIHAQAGLFAANLLGNTASVLAGDVLSATIDVVTELSS